jgi:hypothetical protein
MKNLTWDGLKSEVVRLGKSNPDYVDSRETCTYLRDEQYPGCIIGQALTNLGIDDGTLSKIEDTTPRQAQFSAHLGLPEAKKGTDGLGAARALDYIQGHQDRGFPWGQCISPYKEELL